MFTSDDDKAFDLPLLSSTPVREQKCFQAGAAADAIFVNFKGSSCEAYPDCKNIPDKGPFGKVDCAGKLNAFRGKGHMCPTSAPGVPEWVSPEAQWVLSGLRTYLQQAMSTDSKCYDLLWRGGLEKDPNV